MRTYYQSADYECENDLGRWAGITICGDEDGSRVIFTSDDQVVFDLGIPACESLAMAYALSRSGKHAIRAAERLRDTTPAPAERAIPDAAMPAELPAAERVSLPAYDAREPTALSPPRLMARPGQRLERLQRRAG
jgi:hypothetical protein